MNFVAAIRQLPRESPHALGDRLHHGSASGEAIEEPEDGEFFVSPDPKAAGFFALPSPRTGRRTVSIYRVIAVPQLACFTSHGSPDLGPILAPMDMHALRAAFAASYPHTGVDGWHALQCVLGSETLLHRPRAFLKFDRAIDAPDGPRIDR